MASGIRQLDLPDADAFIALRREALETEPLAFGASVEDDVALVPESVRATLGNREERAIFGRFDDAALVGMIALMRASKVKERHKAMIWGMYVTPRARGRGAGRALLDAAIARAREWGLEQVHLSVTDAAPRAGRLYEAAGFRQWGRAARSLHWKGRFADEIHLVLELT